MHLTPQPLIFVFRYLPGHRFAKPKPASNWDTLLDLQGNIPSFIEITDARLNDVNILDALLPEPGTIYLMDRAYLDYERLYRFHCQGSYFVLRAKSNTQFRRLYSYPNNRDQGLIYDQSGVLTGAKSTERHPAQLRRIKFIDRDRDKSVIVLTNNTYLPALTIAQLYRDRWQVELFFRWLKQHLRIQSFYGISENAVKSQIWIGVSVYVLLAIMKKRMGLDAILYTISQILDSTLFEEYGY